MFLMKLMSKYPKTNREIFLIYKAIFRELYVKDILTPNEKKLD